MMMHPSMRPQGLALMDYRRVRLAKVLRMLVDQPSPILPLPLLPLCPGRCWLTRNVVELAVGGLRKAVVQAPGQADRREPLGVQMAAVAEVAALVTRKVIRWRCLIWASTRQMRAQQSS